MKKKMPFSYSVPLLILNLQLCFGVRCFSRFFLAERENIISNSEQWRAPLCCSFERELNFAKGKRLSLCLPNQTCKRVFFSLQALYVQPMSSLIRWWLALQRPASPHLCSPLPYWVELSPSTQLQDIFWALPVHEGPWGDPGAPLILLLSIYQHAAAYKALTSACRVNSWLLAPLRSFIGSSFHGASLMFNISSFSFLGEVRFFF